MPDLRSGGRKESDTERDIAYDINIGASFVMNGDIHFRDEHDGIEQDRGKKINL